MPRRRLERNAEEEHRWCDNNGDSEAPTEQHRTVRPEATLPRPTWISHRRRHVPKQELHDSDFTPEQPKHESLRDSLIDNAVYSLLAIVLLDEQKDAKR
jgi:hypothetical protein